MLLDYVLRLLAMLPVGSNCLVSICLLHNILLRLLRIDPCCWHDCHRHLYRHRHRKEHPRSEAYEMFESGLWSGPFGENFGTSNVTIERPILDLPQLLTY